MTFPVLLFDIINNSTESAYKCVQWFQECEEHYVHVTDAKNFSDLYQSDKAVWMKQFTVYGFSNVTKQLASKHDQLLGTFYYHPEFHPQADRDKLNMIKRRRAERCDINCMSGQKRRVSFEPSTYLHEELTKNPRLVLYNYSSSSSSSSTTAISNMSRTCSFDDLLQLDHVDFSALMIEDVLTTPFGNYV